MIPLKRRIRKLIRYFLDKLGIQILLQRKRYQYVFPKLILGKIYLKFIVDKQEKKDFKNKLKQYHIFRLRSKMIKKECREHKNQLEESVHECKKNSSLVSAPLVLISQIQRSGGTLLSQLFDGHQELHAHPYELKMGYPHKYFWPEIELSYKPKVWFEILFEEDVINHYKLGYKKGKYEKTYPFIFLPSLQKTIFLKYTQNCKSITLRDIFNAYMTSYFGAWLNNKNRFGKKKFITAFTPRLTMSSKNVASFFEIYPDGKIISIIRDPKNWYSSAVRHLPEYKDIVKAIKLWTESARTALKNKQKYGHSVTIIRFEDLVVKTEAVMRFFAEYLDIKFDPILLVPTFNKISIKADTSFNFEAEGILKSTLSRYRHLTNEQLTLIDSMTKEDYYEVIDQAVKF